MSVVCTVTQWDSSILGSTWEVTGLSLEGQDIHKQSSEDPPKMTYFPRWETTVIPVPTEHLLIPFKVLKMYLYSAMGVL